MTLWRWCAVAGLATLLLTLAFAAVPGITACGPGGAAGPWVDFQNVQSPADVEALIRPDCAARLTPALKLSMILDAVAFIPAYLAFLISAALAVFKGATTGKQRLMKLAIWVTIGGAVFDQIEGGVLLQILGSLPGSEISIFVVVAANLCKSLALAASSALIGVALFERRGWILVAGAVIALSGAASFLFRISSAQLAGGLLAISWLVLFLTAFACSFPRRIAQ
jgi:hypothetical protein